MSCQILSSLNFCNRQSPVQVSSLLVGNVLEAGVAPHNNRAPAGMGGRKPSGPQQVQVGLTQLQERPCACRGSPELHLVPDSSFGCSQIPEGVGVSTRLPRTPSSLLQASTASLRLHIRPASVVTLEYPPAYPTPMKSFCFNFVFLPFLFASGSDVLQTR